jgi:hypothetical protein
LAFARGSADSRAGGCIDPLRAQPAHLDRPQGCIEIPRKFQGEDVALLNNVIRRLAWDGKTRKNLATSLYVILKTKQADFVAFSVLDCPHCPETSGLREPPSTNPHRKLNEH